MKTRMVGLSSCCLSAFCSIVSAQSQHSHPNVILIITDDQGYGDLGITGNPHVKTPVLDKFGRESIRFNNFYVSPVSAPTRSSLMTGRYSMRTGVRDTYNGGAIMASTEITIAEMLKEAGYTTGVFGKWHLGDNYPSRPGDQGFDESVIHLAGGMAQPGDITTYPRGDSAYFDPILWHNGRKEKYDGYCSDVFAGRAIEFIEKNNSSPFFCYLAFNAPHTPLQVPDKYYRMYSDIDPSGGFENDTKPFAKMTEKEKEDARRVYAMVTNIDDNIGQLLGKLDDLGIAENTVVIFMTDNGPQQRRYVAGMRGLKGSVYSGGVRVPFFMRYPALNIQNKDIDATAAHLDVLPTLAQICNARVPADRKIDGVSLLPIIKGEGKPKERSLFFYWTRRNPEKYNNVALMKGKYKLVGHTDYNSGIDEFELFDIEKDPYEQHSIVKENREAAISLKAELDSIFTGLSGSSNMTEPPCIETGTFHENPVILNRNDAGGDRGIWEQEEIYGLWDICPNEGYYNLKFTFKNAVPASGRMVVDLNSVTFQARNNMGSRTILEMKNVHIPGMRTSFVPFYETGGKRLFPLWVEVEFVSQEPPYPASKLISGIEIDWKTHQRHALGSDNFQLTWSDDDHQYGLWGDGDGFAGPNSKYRVSMGVARIEGDYNNYKGFDRYGHKESSENEAKLKGKSWAIISIRGNLYTWIHPDKPAGWGSWEYHHKESRLYMSQDKGASWSPAEWVFTPGDELIGGAILQFGKDNSGSRDKYVYQYLVHPNILKDTAGNATELQVPGHIYLLRVPADKIMDRGSYEFFSGKNEEKPQWSGNIMDKEPVFTDHNGVGTPIGISYNPALKRYLLTTEHSKPHSGMLGIFESPNPWGSWSTVTYLTNETWFGHDNLEIVPQNCFFWCFPTKWMGKDGNEATMVFTGGGRGKNNDSFNTIRVKFSRQGAKKALSGE